MSEFLTIPEIIAAAQAKLSAEIWDFADGGAETEATLAENRRAFDRYWFRPRILRNVRDRSTQTTFLGVPLALPVMLAPIGSIRMFDPAAGLAAARAAHSRGSASFLSTAATPSLEEVAQGSSGPRFFQVYVRGDRTWVEGLVRRVEAAGYAGLCLTVDSPLYGRRERDLHRRFYPRETGSKPNIDHGPEQREYAERFDWDDLAWLRRITRLPLLLKGVMTAEDARLALDHGVDAIYVSNHGGRQLDYSPAGIDLLPEIVAAVAGRAEVVVDSGFVRGTDIVKAIALGARAVLIGKLQCWALAAGGQAGLERALELLQVEISTAMGLLGVTRLDELGPDHLRSAPGR